MSMLAEPRQRKRYNLVPKGKALYEDDARFGTKMLEKMGWSKGKGLGANEDGSQDFVRVRYKNDAQGFGYEQRDDQWTQHEDSFNGLLKTLNGEEDVMDTGDSKTSTEPSNDSEDEIPRVGFGFQDSSKDDTKKKAEKPKKLKEKISGISLEETSKQSRARVHYKKYTKGKDLTQYSEQDLANIFGKKVVDEQQQAANDYYEQLNKSFGAKEEETKEENAIEKLSGVQIISSGVSVQDYFKQKMEQMKNRRNGTSGTNSPVYKIEEDAAIEDQDEEVPQKKKKNKKERKEKVEETEPEKNEKLTDKYASNQIFNTGVSVADYFKKKMEEKKNRLNGIAEKKVEEPITSEIPEEEKVSKKKKKKKKENKEQEEETQNFDGNAEEPPIKMKKSKNREIDAADDVPMEEIEQTISKKDKLKKKLKKDNIEQQNELETTMEEQTKTKKRKNEHSEQLEKPLEEQTKLKKRKNEDFPPEDILEIDLTQEPEKKKKKRNKTQDSTEIITIEDNTSLELETPTDEKVNATEKNQKNKSKNKQKSNESSTKTQAITTTSNNDKKSKKSKTKDVRIEELTIDEIKTKYQNYNIYEISSFCAEKFRNADLNHFKGSTLPHVDGYGLTQSIQLKVEINKNDEERITQMWANTLDKYSQLQKPKKTYHQYVSEVIKARKTKQKKYPKLYVKTWKRKNAFQII